MGRAMADTFLNQTQLARRWGLSPRTLERWRWLKIGPAYTKFGAHVAYAMDDVLAFEQRRRAETHSPTILGSWRKQGRD